MIFGAIGRRGPVARVEVEIPFEVVGRAIVQGVLRLRKCFAFAKHLLRSG
jgi:hypothetical protein